MYTICIYLKNLSCQQFKKHINVQKTFSVVSFIRHSPLGVKHKPVDLSIHYETSKDFRHFIGMIDALVFLYLLNDIHRGMQYFYNNIYKLANDVLRYNLCHWKI